MLYDGLKEAHERAQSKSKVEGSKKIIKSERKRIEAYTTRQRCISPPIRYHFRGTLQMHSIEDGS